MLHRRTKRQSAFRLSKILCRKTPTTLNLQFSHSRFYSGSFRIVTDTGKKLKEKAKKKE